MSTALVPFQEMRGMAEAVAKSGLFGVKTPDQALALMLVAQSEGMHPAAAATDFDIIQGKAARKTHSVLARFQAAGGRVQWDELSDKKARGTFSHPAGGTITIEWTIEQAHAIGLTGKDIWKNYPRAMLRARVIAEAVRTIYPAAIGGSMVSEEAMDVAPMTARDMGAADVVEYAAPPMPAGLLEAAQIEADNGRALFGLYWKALSAEARQALAPHLDDLKQRVAAADASTADAVE